MERLITVGLNVFTKNLETFWTLNNPSSIWKVEKIDTLISGKGQITRRYIFHSLKSELKI